jgi:hypothetical protein
MIQLKSLVTEAMISEALRYHIDKKISIHENVFRYGSESYCKLMLEAKRLLAEGRLDADVYDREVLSTDIGEFGTFKGQQVPLDLPLVENIQEAEYQGKEVQLNKPKRGGSKKYYVYVKNPKTGNVKKISFGDTTGLSAKIHNPEARKSFAARHQCDKKKDRTKAGYWACNLPRYAKSLGMGSNMSTYW